MPEWDCPIRPCVILKVRWDDRTKTYKFTGAPISENQELMQGNKAAVPLVPVASLISDSNKTSISVELDWPLKHAYCYAFKSPATFYCLPSQAPVPSFCTISSSEAETLVSALTPPPDPRRYGLSDDLRSPEPDTRHDAKMRASCVRLYAQISPLTPTQTAQESVDWTSTQAWFDECVKAARFHDMCDGNPRTRAQPDDRSEVNLPNSYYGSDLDSWERLQESDRDLTLAPVLEGTSTQFGDIFEWLDEIELVR